MKILRKFGLGIAGAILFASGVSAATVDFDFGGNTIFSITCNACANGDILGYQTALEGGDALLVGGSFMQTGTAFNPVTGNPGLVNPGLAGIAAEIDFVNTITGESYVSAVKDESGNVPASLGSEYILFKSGQYAGVLQNLSGGALMLTYSGSQAAGLSHVTEFGEVSAVPLPAGGLLLLTALGGGIVASRRRKR